MATITSDCADSLGGPTVHYSPTRRLPQLAGRLRGPTAGRLRGPTAGKCEPSCTIWATRTVLSSPALRRPKDGVLAGRRLR